MNIDDRLSGPLRTLRGHPDALLLGPSGRRLFVDLLDDAPGFRGTIDYVHKLNIPMLFGVEVDSPQALGRSGGTWHPSHLRTRTVFADAVLEETRFVTWTDEAVSIQWWRNTSDRPLTVRGLIDGEWCVRVGEGAAGERRIEAHGFTVRLTVRADTDELWGGVTLMPGETRRLCVVASVRHESWDPEDPTVDQGSSWDPASEDLLERQIAEYQGWFDAVPDLVASDPMISRAWAYRWYVLRNTMAMPEMGILQGPVFYEGRSHKLAKDPWRPRGWDFGKMIPLSTPFHLMDLRWHGDIGRARDAARSVVGVQGTDGQLYASTVREQLKPYASYFGHALAQWAHLRGYERVPDDVLAAARSQVLGERRALEAAEDELPVQRDHKLTGKEYQPSYWAFHGYPADPTDEALFTPLKRVDRAVYQLLNARGAAEMLAARGMRDAELESISAQVAESVRTKMWDPAVSFFVDIRAEDDASSAVRNIVGFYPWWAEIADETHDAGLSAALEPKAFGTTAFRAQGGWLGQFLKGRNGCMWNGPAWPYTTCIALDAVARAAIRTGDARFDVAFARGLRSYVRSHFRDGDPSSPYLVEHYDPLTAEPISDEPDYSHSSLIDLLVTRVVGLHRQGDDWRLRPLDIGVPSLHLSGVPLRRHQLDIGLRWESGRPYATLECGCGTWHDGVIPPTGITLDRAELACA
jgi:hypothetical protein